MFKVKIKVLWICRLTHFGLQADYKSSFVVVTGILGMTKNLFCFTIICFAPVFLIYFTMWCATSEHTFCEWHKS